MKTLLIKDLSITSELDRAAMASVQGGYGKEVFAQYGEGQLPGYPKNELKFDASQMLSQSQNTLVNNGNNAAFVCGISSTVNPSQSGTNNISFG
jgi:hypothetical protein